mgnify:CR=1 FL=1
MVVGTSQTIEICLFDLPRVDTSVWDHPVASECSQSAPRCQKLDLSKYVLGYGKGDNKYELYGICNHSGGTMGGHYTSYVKNANMRMNLRSLHH